VIYISLWKPESRGGEQIKFQVKECLVTLVQEASSLDTLPQIKNVEGSFVHAKLSP
jgi:hypothetical protein